MKKYKRCNKIYLDYKINDVRKRVSTGLEWTKENLKQVDQTIIPKILIRIENGAIYKKKPKTFAYYSEFFLKQQESKQSYYQKEPYWSRSIDHFKTKNIDEITALDVQNYINNLDMKPKSKKEYLFAIRGVFKYAVMDGVVPYNLANDIDCGKDKKSSIDYFTHDEVSKIIHASKQEIPEFKNYLLIALNTGLRPEELLGLKWSDFNDGFFFIQRARTKGRIVPTKTPNGIRKVRFKYFDDLVQNNDLFLFPNQNDSSHFRSQWKRVLNNANVKYRALKNLRHTFATLSLQNGIPLNVLSSVLGHSSPKVTLEHYSSVVKQEQITYDDRLFGTKFGT